MLRVLIDSRNVVNTISSLRLGKKFPVSFASFYSKKTVSSELTEKERQRNNCFDLLIRKKMSTWQVFIFSPRIYRYRFFRSEHFYYYYFCLILPSRITLSQAVRNRPKYIFNRKFRLMRETDRKVDPHLG